MIAEADTLLQEFNNEKHEVKAKFKHLMQILALKATGSNMSESGSVKTDDDPSIRAS